MRLSAGAAALAAALTLLAGARAASAAREARADFQHVSFRDGERLVFQLRWRRIPIATTTLSAAGPLRWQGKRVFRFQALTRSLGWLDRIYTVRDLAESHVDANRLFSYRFELRQRQGRYRSHKWYTFEGKRATYIRATRPPRYYTTPGEVQDALSAFYLIRTKKLAPGTDIQIPIFDSKRNWRVRVRIHREEWLETLWGPVKTLFVEPELQSDSFFRRRGKVWIWVTADELHVPVRVESTTVFGPFTAHLIAARGLRRGPLASPPVRKIKTWRPSTRIVRAKKASAGEVIKAISEILDRKKKRKHSNK